MAFEDVLGAEETDLFLREKDERVFEVLPGTHFSVQEKIEGGKRTSSVGNHKTKAAFGVRFLSRSCGRSGRGGSAWLILCWWGGSCRGVRRMGVLLLLSLPVLVRNCSLGGFCAGGSPTAVRAVRKEREPQQLFGLPVGRTVLVKNPHPISRPNGFQDEGVDDLAPQLSY